MNNLVRAIPLSALLLSLLAACPGRVLAQNTVLEDRAEQIVAHFVEDSELEADLFHAEFLRKVSAKRMRGIFANYRSGGGACLSATALHRNSPYRGEFLLSFEEERVALLSLVVSAREPHSITTFLIKPLQRTLRSLQEAADELKHFPGQVSFAICRLKEGKVTPLASLEPDLALGIGSAFKLYVLGRLCEEVAAHHRSWSDDISLKSDWMSIPSGFLHTWPAGARLNLYSLAALMISQSDNTAADHLLHLLGRQHVEASLETMGNRSIPRNVPFIATSEMFRLKASEGGKHIAPYLAGSVSEKRKYLSEIIAPLPVQEVDLLALTEPTAIDKIEWFASALDLCRAMDWLRQATEEGEAQEARAILAINPGLPVPRGAFRYVGYKGGSEGGVLNSTFLLQTVAGDWYAMAATWNNKRAPVDMQRLYDLETQVLFLLGMI